METLMESEKLRQIVYAVLFILASLLFFAWWSGYVKSDDLIWPLFLATLLLGIDRALYIMALQNSNSQKPI
jgi:hypothetical protein